MPTVSVKTSILREAPIAAPGRLLRVLGVGFGLAVTVGNTIGAGILRTPGEVAAHLPNPLLFISVWLLGGLYALLCSFSIAEIATMLPQSGGHYIYARYTFGDYPGFIVGWCDWLSNCGATAAVSMIVGEYCGLLFPALAGKSRELAALVVIVFGLLQWRGIHWGSGVQQVTSLLKALGFTALTVACFVTAHRLLPPAAALPVPHGWALLAAVILSLQAAIYTYDGWTGVIYFSEEVHDPARDIPRSMFGGIFAVISIYVLLNIALLHVLPVGRMAGDPLPLGTAARLIWGAHADTVVQVLVIVSMLSAINAYELMSCRTIFAMSRDGLFPRAANRVNRGGTPDIALLLSSIACTLFIASGTFEQVIAVMAFFFVFNYVAGLSAVLVLRRREPHHERPYRAWGYPWTTAAALCGSLTFLGGAVYSDRRNSIFALIVLAASYPVFLLITSIGQEPLFSFQGRIRRSRFWCAQLLLLSIGIGLVVVAPVAIDRGDSAAALFAVLRLLLGVPIAWVALATYARRWHDAGMSAWMNLTLFIPLINIVSAIICGCLPGTIGPNKYGDDPRGVLPPQPTPQSGQQDFKSS
jgi:basic amino acid/polyamine antiporter, APA family